MLDSKLFKALQVQVLFKLVGIASFRLTRLEKIFHSSIPFKSKKETGVDPAILQRSESRMARLIVKSAQKLMGN